jgi:predicted alpha/beta superfamily hydrolase
MCATSDKIKLEKRLFIYINHGEREDNDHSIHRRIVAGESDDVALCYAHTKKEAGKIFKEMYNKISGKVHTLDEVFFNDFGIACLTKY